MKWFITGGAGFFGYHLVNRLMSDPLTDKLTVFDNMSNGREIHYKHHLNDRRFTFIKGEIKELNHLVESMKGHDVVVHLASNPDISKAMTDPQIDFYQGTLLTNNVLEAMRITNTNRIIYSSGSGVYGISDKECFENQGNMYPVSTYGASKLAGETLISSYCHMFDMQGLVFRFGNLVGSSQTHGVCYDFLKRLIKDQTKLTILGNGSQYKSYIAISDVINAVLLANEKLASKFEVYNVATGDYITVKEIVQLCLEGLGLSEQTTKLEYGTENIGWRGDVNKIELNTDKIRSLGWENIYNTKEALQLSIQFMIEDIKDNKI